MFDLILDQKSTKIFAKLVYRRPRKGVSDATFEGKKHQPKFKDRILRITQRDSDLLEWGHQVTGNAKFDGSMHHGSDR